MSILQLIAYIWKLFFPWALVVVVIASTLYVYFSTHENSGSRGVITYLGHLIVIGLGWLLGRWIGLFLISLPILVFYYYLLFHLALVVVPLSDPDNWREWIQRFLLLVWYQWGVQYPLWIVSDTVGQGVEIRIPGDQFGSFAPGLVWARSHQVVGLTTGLAFSGVRQSGVVFTKAYERPLGVVDLRIQLRTSWIEVVSSDGIPYKALLFAAFAADREKWDRDLYHQLVRENPSLRNAKEPDRTSGTYHFSRARLHALFSTIGISSPSDDSSKPKTIEWDESALYQIERATREILSQRRLDNLWQPEDDRNSVNAMDEIAGAIRDRCFLQLKKRGVHLYSCRIVNFEFPRMEAREEKDDEIRQKQLKAWSADWQREAEQTRAEGRAEADLLKQEARAYAYTNLLTAVAEGLQETRLLDPHIAHYVIAVRFVSAMEGLIEEQPEGEESREARTSLEEVKKMIPWATRE